MKLWRILVSSLLVVTLLFCSSEYMAIVKAEENKEEIIEEEEVELDESKNISEEDVIEEEEVELDESKNVSGEDVIEEEEVKLDESKDVSREDVIEGEEVELDGSKDESSEEVLTEKESESEGDYQQNSVNSLLRSILRGGTLLESMDMSVIFSTWVNYPNSSLGYGYSAGWSYSEAEGLNTSANVGWTGFYNPDIIDFTTGVFEFELLSSDNDPLGFTWGMQTGGTESDPTYSFYAFEECGHGNWSVAYIEEWRPALNTSSHRGPLYHSTIDASDGQYSSHDGGTGTVGFATGTVLAYGTLPGSIGTPATQHKVKIEVEGTLVNIYLNDEFLVTVNTPVVAGSFGPFATSNPRAHIFGLSYTTFNDAILTAKFEYQDENGVKVNESEVGNSIVVKDLSTYESSPIQAWIWTVLKDGAEIYSGTTPYTEYHKEVGIYETILLAVNELGMQSNEYRDILIVTEKSLPITLTPKFEYQNKDGVQVNKTEVGTAIAVKDLSTYENSPIKEWNWTVLKDGVEIYTGTTPYTKYHDEAGTYETILTVVNEQGMQSDEYRDILVVTEKSLPITLTAKFEYQNKDGVQVNETEVGTAIAVKDLSTYENSPIKEWNWTVLKDGVKIYTGTIPYTKYHDEAGTYETILTVVNEQGMQSDEYRDILVVKKKATTSISGESVKKATTSVSNESVKTGDMSGNNFILNIALLLLSIGIIIVTGRKINKNKNTYKGK